MTDNSNPITLVEEQIDHALPAFTGEFDHLVSGERAAVAKVEAPVVSAEESMAKFRAEIVAETAALKARVDTMESNVEAFVSAAKAREEALVAKVKADVAALKSVESKTIGFFAKIKSFFGGAK